MREVILHNEAHPLEFGCPGSRTLVYSGSTLAKGVRVQVGAPITMRHIDQGQYKDRLVIPFELWNAFLFDDGFILCEEIASNL